MGVVMVPLAAGIILSFCIEQLLQPRPALGARQAKAYAIHVGLWLLFFAFGLALWQRPYFASGLNLAGMLIIVLVSNAKFATLREPFLLSDFRFFKALLQHPRLYLPFFGVLPAIACALVFIAFCIVVTHLEASILRQGGPSVFAALCVALGAVGAALLWMGARNPAPVTLDPALDLKAFGLLGSFVRYWQAEQASNPKEAAARLSSAFRLESVPAESAGLPNIVAVQCESFFDARRVYSGIHPDVLKNFDALTKMSSSAGRLNVAAWGANTVRTEFAFLSGLRPAALGVHQFNPYRKLARQGVPTIASELKKCGYRTICVHPYAPGFYDRDVVFPGLGFDEFVDMNAFSEADLSGPYVGDLAVADKVAELFANATGPLFVFVITMENHGPLHQEKVADGDAERLYLASPPKGFDELTIYLRHLQHTDAMLGKLHAMLIALQQPGWLCAYGDHVPILPSVYSSSGFVDGNTDYLIIGPEQQHGGGLQHDLPPEELGMCLLRLAGFIDKKRNHKR